MSLRLAFCSVEDTVPARRGQDGHLEIVLTISMPCPQRTLVLDSGNPQLPEPSDYALAVARSPWHRPTDI